MLYLRLAGDLVGLRVGFRVVGAAVVGLRVGLREMEGAAVGFFVTGAAVGEKLGLVG